MGKSIFDFSDIFSGKRQNLEGILMWSDSQIPFFSSASSVDVLELTLEAGREKKRCDPLCTNR